MALIEIDVLPINSMVDLSMANCECHNQMVRPHAPGHNKIGDRGARRLASLLDPDYCLQALLGGRLVRPHRGLAHFKSCCGETLVGPFLENDLWIYMIMSLSCNMGPFQWLIGSVGPPLESYKQPVWIGDCHDPVFDICMTPKEPKAPLDLCWFLLMARPLWPRDVHFSTGTSIHLRFKQCSLNIF